MKAPAQIWILAADDPAIGALIKTARRIDGEVDREVVALVVGRRCAADALATADVDRVLWLSSDASEVPCEAHAPQVGQLVADASPRVVLGPTTAAGRVLLGAVAARLCAPILARVTALDMHGERMIVERDVFGGIAQRREATSSVAIMAMDGGAQPDRVGAPVAVEKIAATPLRTARIIDRRATQPAAVDLGAARTVVAVGRGLKSERDLSLIQDLARAVGGELACSRPLAEGVHWMPKDRYVGISGQHIAPDMYFAIGISGQFHHMIGVGDAKVIVAVNSDQAAPVFAQCDYGIVGDLYTIVPALTAALTTS